jgi:hypothetical protein
LKDGTIGRIQNVPVTTTYVQEPSDSAKHEKACDKTRKAPHKYSPEDTSFAKEENSNQIKWIKKEEY